MAVVREFGDSVPILGVCLGHQSIAQALGGNIVRAKQVMHGKTSPIRHKGSDIFRGLGQPFIATRYHSLIVEKESLPIGLEVTAWTESENGNVEEIMGLRHEKLPLYSVQFHPESIFCEGGHQLLENFFTIAAETL
jgi:anthranilate synthase component 2